ncbi:hypothetical protein GWK47_042262 [Chionoecetes opilio]|uniref:Uncharacterized protein n=1 Tax=Chionoecetes opilio TaxID=41210 RepID=A0A8J5D067_CHIOP|nr:hypothetical protein GWK47_042262 [Chionoecetes opilio]
MILSKEVTTKLDRFKVSDPAAMAVVGAVAKATGQNIDNITLSTSFIHRHRRKNRKEVATAEKIELPERCLVLLHCDAMQLPDIAGRRKRVERLAIHVTGGDKEYLLEVAKIPQGTGHHMAEAVLKAVSDAGLEARI